MMEQILQLVGAFLVLGGFAGSQLRWFDIRSPRYLLLNVIGSGILAVIAIHQREWGFILLESSWTIVSLIGLVRVLTTRPATT